MIREIRTLFKKEEEKEEVISGIINKEYETNGDKTRNFSLDKYLNEIEPYLRNIIINL